MKKFFFIKMHLLHNSLFILHSQPFITVKVNKFTQIIKMLEKIHCNIYKPVDMRYIIIKQINIDARILCIFRSTQKNEIFTQLNNHTWTSIYKHVHILSQHNIFNMHQWGIVHDASYITWCGWTSCGCRK